MDYPKITSLANPKIKELLDIKRRKVRDKYSPFLIEGPHLIEMALNTKTPLKEIFFSEVFVGKKEGQSILRQLSEQNTL